MKIIVLWGKHDSGKTTTIKFLRDILLKRGVNETKIVDEYDFISVFYFQDKKVGVISGGDTKEILTGNFGELPNDCDIIICPSRTKGGTVQYLEELVFSQKDLIWVKKAEIKNNGKYSVEKEENIINLIQAEILFEELKLQL